MNNRTWSAEYRLKVLAPMLERLTAIDDIHNILVLQACHWIANKPVDWLQTSIETIAHYYKGVTGEELPEEVENT